MKRLHVHVSVDDLAQSIRFYSTLFAAQPAVTSGESTVYGDSVDLGPIRTAAAGTCCTPATPQGACCGVSS